MGPRLAEIYVVAIKNLDACRNCSSDFLAKFLQVLTDLSKRLHTSSGKGTNSNTSNGSSSASASGSGKVEGTGLGAWVWVTGELQRTQELIDMKNNGDRLFRAASHTEAIQAYSTAIHRIDPQAVRWAAILYNNRAAARMAVGQLAEAIADCHEALTRDPQYSRVYLRRARALSQSKSFAGNEPPSYLPSIPPIITIHPLVVPIYSLTCLDLHPSIPQSPPPPHTHTHTHTFFSFPQRPYVISADISAAMTCLPLPIPTTRPR